MNYFIDLEGNEFVMLSSLLYTEEAPYSNAYTKTGWKSAAPSFEFILHAYYPNESPKLTSIPLREHLKNHTTKGEYFSNEPYKELE